MSYTPTEWKSGDTITSAKLNKIEQGIAAGGGGGGGGVLVVGVDWDVDNGTLDKTWSEIYTASQSSIVMLSYEDDGFFEHRYLTATEEYVVYFGTGDSEVIFTAESADDYPVYQNPS